ncbi:MAG: biosynthetic arginine decarboxylase [Phycisphaerales bacterium]
MTTAPVHGVRRETKREDSILASRAPTEWSTGDSASLYGLDEWGQGYFAVGADGNLLVQPDKDEGRRIDLHKVIQGLDERGITTPIIVRFKDMVAHRLREIRGAFDAAMADNAYTGGYSCIYPIKVNQQRHVCEEIRDIGGPLGFGLEAGSKPELLAVLGLTENMPDMPIVCNGFKDDEYVEMAILAHKLGRTITPVVERYRELELLLKHAKAYGVRPRIGMRCKPSARGAGRWESSGGMRSKFGLQVSGMIDAMDLLRQHGMLDCLKMLHFHVGSQICDIRQFKNAVSELANMYTEMARLGAGMDTIDIGGGLGVDYDGSQSAWASSMNYTLREYAADVVYRIKAACESAGVAHPRIFSESGRAMVAYSSVLVVDVLGRNRYSSDPDMPKVRSLIAAEPDGAPQPILDLIDAYEGVAKRDPVEVHHDAAQAYDEALSLFTLGYLSLPMRAAAERLFWATGRQVLARAQGEAGTDDLHEDLQVLPEFLSDIYFCNFSVFQSLPDSWAIDQIFPICPIHRLNEKPTRRATIADMSCDSDGKVDKFACVDHRDFKPVIEVHDLLEGQTYYLGFFLVGAYQEVLGDLHNLFGDTHVVHVSLDGEGGWEIDEIVEGDTVREVLSYVEFDHEDLERSVRRDTERAVKKGTMSVGDARSLMRFYEGGLEGYTYLE